MFGLLGAALAQTASLITSNLLRLYFVWSRLGLFPYHYQSLRLLLPMAVSTATLFFVRALMADSVLGPAGILLTTLSAVIVFIVASYYWGFNEDDQMLINQLKQKMRIANAA